MRRLPDVPAFAGVDSSSESSNPLLVPHGTHCLLCLCSQRSRQISPSPCMPLGITSLAGLLREGESSLRGSRQIRSSFRSGSPRAASHPIAPTRHTRHRPDCHCLSPKCVSPNLGNQESIVGRVQAELLSQAPDPLASYLDPPTIE